MPGGVERDLFKGIEDLSNLFEPAGVHVWRRQDDLVGRGRARLVLPIED